MSTTTKQDSPPRLKPGVLIPILLFFLALGLRLIGIGWGLPNEEHHFSYHPDEPIVLGYATQIEPTALDFDPNFYNYGTLYLTLSRIGMDMVSAYSGGPEENNPKSQIEFVAKSHLAGRIISALAGAGTVLVVFFTLRRFTNLLGATLGSLLILVAPAHVMHSRFQSVDVLATFLLAVSTLFAIKLATLTDEEIEAGRNVALKMAMGAGAFAGLSAGTKYTGILVLLSLFVAVFVARRKDGLKLAAIGFIAAVVAFFIATPGALTNNAQFMKDLAYETLHTSTGHGLAFVATPSGFIYHLMNLSAGVGLLLLLFGLLGLGVAAFRKYKWALVLVAFFIPYYLAIGRAEVKFIRYTFPLCIGLACGFGWLVGSAHERKGKYRFITAAGILALGGSGLTGLGGAVTTTAWMAGEDPRDSTAEYLRLVAEEKPGTTVGFVSDPWYYSPPLFSEVGVPRGGGVQAWLEPMRRTTSPKVVRYLPSNVDQRRDWDIRLLTELKPDYVVFSSFENDPYERMVKLGNPTEEQQLLLKRRREFGEVLSENYDNVVLFGGPDQRVEDLMYVHPVLYIWKRKSQP